MHPKPANLPSEEELRDLGFGSVVAQESRDRLLNRDGSFNVARRGLGLLASISPYHAILTMSWARFFAMVSAGYLATNALFAFAYLLCGPGSLAVDGRTGTFTFADAFFFSVQTLATIGYGRVAPMALAANLVVTVESLVGLLGFALATGLLFARFSRPMADIVFSRKAVIAPYRGGTAFEFRIANKRANELIELEAKVLFSRLEGAGERRVRRFYNLSLERERVVFFPLSWTVVHPIDETSPLHGLAPPDLDKSDAEFLILLTGTDETFSQMVHSRSSYKPHEVAWNARFTEVFRRPPRGGTLAVDIGRIHGIEELTLQEGSRS